MTLLFTVLTAAYGKGTHHRLALDGVRRLDGPGAEAWQRLFYKHADVLVTGSKAPDDQFKDFKNHVLHPRDNFWGGAPDKARSWYIDLVETLAKGDWPAAVWCAGVLSHYVTDPINPFHTAQSEAENAIHRAFEWSISTSYADLKKIANADAPREINVTDGTDWLEQLVCQAASDANQHYEKLIAHYDIHRGVVDPPSGLDSIARPIIGDLIGQASAVFAAVLQRAIAESKATPPDVNLTLDMILATIKIPVAKLLKKLADKEERRLVERMYDELKATGTVEVNLPEDDRAVRDLYAEEVLGRRAAPKLENRFPAKGRKRVETEGEQKERLKRIGTRSIPAPGAGKVAKPAAADTAQEVPVDEPARPAPKAADQSVPAGPVGRFRGEPVSEPAREAVTTSVPTIAAKANVAVGDDVPAATPRAEGTSRAESGAQPAEPAAAAARAIEPAAPASEVIASPAAPAMPMAEASTQEPAVAVTPVPPSPAAPDVRPAPRAPDLPMAALLSNPGPASVSDAHTPSTSVPAVPRQRLVTALASVQPPAQQRTLPQQSQQSQHPQQPTPILRRPPTPITQPRPAAAGHGSAAPDDKNGQRLYLTPGQPIVDAPSIGPKMAERLIPLGIVTVTDLLKANPGNLAAKLAMSIIDADAIVDWQDQARLVCTVPGLRGTHAQLLVGAGFRSAEAIADADPAQLCARVLTFATGKEGQRLLRNGDPPDIERIKSWVDNARAVRAA